MLAPHSRKKLPATGKRNRFSRNTMVQGLMDHQGSRTDFGESQKEARGLKP